MARPLQPIGRWHYIPEHEGFGIGPSMVVSGLLLRNRVSEMDITHQARLIQGIPDSARVVDVGGGASPFPRADYVIDSLPYSERGSLDKGKGHLSVRYTEATWVRLDLCDHRPWPFQEKFFDFATCSHLLEDVRDPVWVCQELCRIAKAGYIEVPSRIVEQSVGVESPRYAGYYHHRWLITKSEKGLEFRHKPHSLHSIRSAIVARVGIRRSINPRHAILALDWKEGFPFREVLEFDEGRVAGELIAFAEQARKLPDLTVPSNLSLPQRLRRMVYFWRLRRGKLTG